MKKKVKVKKQVYYILIVIVILAIGAFYGYQKYQEYLYHQTYEYKLSTIGYSIEEAKLLEEKLPAEKLEFILNEKRSDIFVNLAQEKYFIAKEFDNYYAYYLKHKKMEIKDIVSIINCKVDQEYYSLALPTDMSKEEAIIVNKYYTLKEDYIPDDLVNVSMDYAWGNYGDIRVRKIAYDNFLDMWQAASQAGYYLMINSAFRTYQEQEIVFNNYKDSYGEDYALSIAAKPGYSEHQTGLALDIFSKTNSNRKTFKDSEVAKWLADNAYKFGFILRYPSDKVDLTGYDYEAWHFRYVGPEIAKYIYENDITFEEYYAYFLDK